MTPKAPVVVIPFYQTSLSPSELFSFAHNTKLLAKFRIVAVCPQSIKESLQKILVGIHPQIELVTFEDTYFGSIAGYNRLLKSNDFYRRFAKHEYLLLVQTDALAITNELEKWCSLKYSYIGAPWFDGFTHPTKPLQFIGVGNGGFSLRRVQDFIDCLQKNTYLPNSLAKKPNKVFDVVAYLRFLKHHYLFAWSKGPLQTKVNEDVFWGLLIPKRYQQFKVAPIDKAIEFAFDAEPHYLYELNHQKLPFGCHAWERYDRDFWLEKLGYLGIIIPNRN
jgi:Protein of unknown function (DUF5672)